MAKRGDILLSRLARELHEEDAEQGEDSILDTAGRFARAIDRRWTAPFDHLAPIVADLEEAFRMARARDRTSPAVRAVEHAAVQHGKTTLIQGFVTHCLRYDPTLRIGYGSYSEDRATDKMWRVRDLAPRFGIQLHPDAAKKTKWYTKQGGFVYSGGIIGGTWTGDGLDVIVLDDLYKGHLEADSRAHREAVEKSLEDNILTRVQDWTPIIVNMARWGPQDISAHLIQRGWRYNCLPAISEDGQPLNPAFKTLERLLLLRDGDHARGIDPIDRRTWYALYQGNPRPEGQRVFDGQCPTYVTLPTMHAYTEAIGIDVAYGRKARHDRSSLCVFRRYVNEPRVLYLVETWSGREAVELFACRVAAVQIRRGGGPSLPLPRTPADIERAGGWRDQLRTVSGVRRVPARWYTSTTETGAAELMRGYGAHVEPVRAAVDKLARAQAGGYTAAWAEGRVRVPAREDEHVRAWRVAHEDFTGGDGDRDDPVDAAVAAHDVLRVAVAGLGGAGRFELVDGGLGRVA